MRAQEAPNSKMLKPLTLVNSHAILMSSQTKQTVIGPHLNLERFNIHEDSLGTVRVERWRPN